MPGPPACVSHVAFFTSPTNEAPFSTWVFAFVFPITHIAGGVYLYSAMAYGMTFVLAEAFDPATTIDLLRREGVTQAGAGTFFHQVYLAAQQALPDGEQPCYTPTPPPTV